MGISFTASDALNQISSLFSTESKSRCSDDSSPLATQFQGIPLNSDDPRCSKFLRVNRKNANYVVRSLKRKTAWICIKLRVEHTRALLAKGIGELRCRKICLLSHSKKNVAGGALRAHATAEIKRQRKLFPSILFAARGAKHAKWLRF